MKAVCQALGLARLNVHRLRTHPENCIDARTKRPVNVSDATLLDEIKAQITELPAYGYRRLRIGEPAMHVRVGTLRRRPLLTCASPTASSEDMRRAASTWPRR